MKKILATALAVTLTFGAYALPAVGNDFGVANKFGITADARVSIENTAFISVPCEVDGDYGYNVLDDGTVEIVAYSGSSDKLVIPDTIAGKKVTSIGNHPFANNQSITSVTIPNSITSIGDNAFRTCYNLTNITIPNSVISIGDYAFYGCIKLKNVTIPNSVTSIGNSTFYGCEKLASVTIPNGVTSIGNSAFCGCEKLTSVTIPNSVTSIGNSAFFDCEGLTDITIPNSITSIGDGAFYSCLSLTNITVDSNNKYYVSEDGVLFNKGKTTLICCPAGNERTTYTIPSHVTKIGNYAFSNCSKLTSLTIPGNVTSIGNSAFQWCSNLTNITIPDSVTSIGNSAFSSCSRLTDITLTKGVTNIGYYVFSYCCNLTNITIPNSVTNIGNGAFNWCSNLKSITIPNSVTSIGDSAFNYCDNLKDIYYKGTESEWENIDIDWHNESLTNATIHYNSTGDSDTQKEISSCTISLPTSTQYFRGTRIRPVVTIKDGTKVLKSGTDYTVSYTNNLSVGKATVTITGKGDYKGTVTKNFDIVQRSIGNCDVELGAANYYFNGTRIKPSVKVYCNGVEMYNGNYTVAYSNNLSAGTATITLTGKKNLKGTVTKTFKINPRNIANCTVELTKNSANKYQPTVAVKIGSNSVYNGNYTVKYVTSADKKTVKVTLTGKGNLAGTVTKTYTVA